MPDAYAIDIDPPVERFWREGRRALARIFDLWRIPIMLTNSGVANAMMHVIAIIAVVMALASMALLIAAAEWWRRFEAPVHRESIWTDEGNEP